MYELIIHFFEFGSRKMPLLPGGELQVILYSINLPLSLALLKNYKQPLAVTLPLIITT